MPNNPWELYRLTKRWADQGINISLSTANPRKPCAMILAVDQPANAVELISRLASSGLFVV